MNLLEDCIEIKCYNEEEWMQIQEYAFSLGMEWPVGKVFEHMKGSYPKYLYFNYIDTKLCWDTGSDPEDEIIKFRTTASVILRKSKLEKINGR